MRKRKKYRRDKTLKYTTNSRVYKMTKMKIELSCPICSPNKGCNRRRSYYNRNWKHYRKTQWKN